MVENRGNDIGSFMLAVMHQTYHQSLSLLYRMQDFGILFLSYREQTHIIWE
jgi:hypothetical protein